MRNSFGSGKGLKEVNLAYIRTETKDYTADHVWKIAEA